MVDYKKSTYFCKNCNEYVFTYRKYYEVYTPSERQEEYRKTGVYPPHLSYEKHCRKCHLNVEGAKEKMQVIYSRCDHCGSMTYMADIPPNIEEEYIKKDPKKPKKKKK